MNLILFIAALVVFFTYLLYTGLKFGILPSISASAYVVKPRILFTLFLWILGALMFAIGLTPLMFGAMAFLAFCGTAGWGMEDTDPLQDKIHVVGATGAIILGFVSLGTDFHMYWLSAPMIIFAGYCMYFNGKIKGIEIKNTTYYIEVVAFLLIMAGLTIAKL